MTEIGGAVRDFFTEGRPLVEQALDLAEQFKSFREAAREKGIDWSQIKSLLKAHILDERDESGEGARVQTIIDKADAAACYADLLGFGNKVAEKNISREITNPVPVKHDTAIPADLSIPPFLQRTA